MGAIRPPDHSNNSQANATKAKELVDAVYHEYMKDQGGISEDLFRQLFQASLEKNKPIIVDGKVYGAGQEEELIAKMMDWKAKHKAEEVHKEGFGGKVSSAIQMLIEGSHQNIHLAASKSGGSNELSKEDENELKDRLAKIKEGLDLLWTCSSPA